MANYSVYVRTRFKTVKFYGTDYSWLMWRLLIVFHTFNENRTVLTVRDIHARIYWFETTNPVDKMLDKEKRCFKNAFWTFWTK